MKLGQGLGFDSLDAVVVTKFIQTDSLPLDDESLINTEEEWSYKEGSETEENVKTEKPHIE